MTKIEAKTIIILEFLRKIDQIDDISTKFHIHGPFQVGKDKKSGSSLDTDLFTNYCTTKHSHIFYIENHRTPSVKRKENH